MGEHLARLSPLIHAESQLPFLKWVENHYNGQFLSPFLPQNFWAEKPGLGLEASGNDNNHPSIVLAPGATWPSKEWPLSNWEKLIENLLEATDHQLLVIQPPASDQWISLGGLIPPNRGRLLPVMNLEQVLGVISRSALLVSVDGGIMHAGVGLGVPTIGLFGPTDPSLWFPYEKSGPYKVMTSRAQCAPCHLHKCDDFICMPELLPGPVMNQCLNLIGQGSD